MQFSLLDRRTDGQRFGELKMARNHPKTITDIIDRGGLVTECLAICWP
jgi:hypothetical protein